MDFRALNTDSSSSDAQLRNLTHFVQSCYADLPFIGDICSYKCDALGDGGGSVEDPDAAAD